MEGMDIRLAAPTGRAAKRMTETCGYEAQTIHRLLEVSGKTVGELTGKTHFERNEDNPLETDVIIVDEMSMVDELLCSQLFQGIPKTAKIILLGDTKQLPSIRAGRVLKDLIESGIVPVISLNVVKRQEAKSGILINATKITNGEHISPVIVNEDSIKTMLI